MPKYVTKVRTEDGDLQIDYEALANLPKPDTTLSKSGSFADAKVVGDQIDYIKNEMGETISKKAETAVYTGTFKSSGWSSSKPYIQTITVSGILFTDTPFVDVDLTDVSDGTDIIDAWMCVGRVTATADNEIVGYCYEEKPTVNIPIILKVVR